MKIENQVCLPYQSLRLRDFNLRQNSFMYYVSEIPGALDNYELVAAFGYSWSDYPCYSSYPTIISAYTVAELGIMLGINNLPYYYKEYDMWMLDKGSNLKGAGLGSEHEAVIRAELLIYALENNLLSSEICNSRLFE